MTTEKRLMQKKAAPNGNPIKFKTYWYDNTVMQKNMSIPFLFWKLLSVVQLKLINRVSLHFQQFLSSATWCTNLALLNVIREDMDDGWMSTFRAKQIQAI